MTLNLRTVLGGLLIVGDLAALLGSIFFLHQTDFSRYYLLLHSLVLGVGFLLLDFNDAMTILKTVLPTFKKE